MSSLSKMAQHLRGTSAEKALLAAYATGERTTPHQTLVDAFNGDQETASETANTLRSLALAHDDVSLAGETTLTVLGRDLANFIQSSRHSGIERHDAIQKTLLASLKDMGPNQTAGDVVQTMAAGTVFGTQVSQDEVLQAAQALDDLGLITAEFEWGGGLLHADVTSKGRTALTQPGMISERHDRAGSTTYSN